MSLESSAELASIAANQANTTKALEALASEVAAARRENQSSTLEMTKRLGIIETTHARSASVLEQHIKLADERHSVIWRVLKWVAGLVLGSGTVIGGAKLSGAVGLL